MSATVLLDNLLSRILSAVPHSGLFSIKVDFLVFVWYIYVQINLNHVVVAWFNNLVEVLRNS